jgi:antiviral helicase SKI2
MDVETQADLIQKIVSPRSDYAAGLLDGLGLSGPPSREQIHAEIEERLLLPKQKLPDHWLPKYQM